MVEFNWKGDTDLYEEESIFDSAKPGDLVAVRPCAERYGDKTYLGIFIGYFARGVGIEGDGENYVLSYLMHNPAIFIPETKSVVFGAGSWWHVIGSPEELEEITNETIQNTWYVKALKEMFPLNENADDKE